MSFVKEMLRSYARPFTGLNFAAKVSFDNNGLNSIIDANGKVLEKPTTGHHERIIDNETIYVAPGPGFTGATGIQAKDNTIVYDDGLAGLLPNPRRDSIHTLTKPGQVHITPESSDRARPAIVTEHLGTMSQKPQP